MTARQPQQKWQFGLGGLLTLVTAAAIFCALLPRDSVPVLLQFGMVLLGALASLLLALLVAWAPVVVLQAAARLLRNNRRRHALFRRLTNRIDAR